MSYKLHTYSLRLFSKLYLICERAIRESFRRVHRSSLIKPKNSSYTWYWSSYKILYWSKTWLMKQWYWYNARSYRIQVWVTCSFMLESHHGLWFCLRKENTTWRRMDCTRNDTRNDEEEKQQSIWSMNKWMWALEMGLKHDSKHIFKYLEIDYIYLLFGLLRFRKLKFQKKRFRKLHYI